MNHIELFDRNEMLLNLFGQVEDEAAHALAKAWGEIVNSDKFRGMKFVEVLWAVALVAGSLITSVKEEDREDTLRLVATMIVIARSGIEDIMKRNN